MSKELKGGMMTVSNQMENINKKLHNMECCHEGG